MESIVCQLSIKSKFWCLNGTFRWSQKRPTAGPMWTKEWQLSSHPWTIKTWIFFLEHIIPQSSVSINSMDWFCHLARALAVAPFKATHITPWQRPTTLTRIYDDYSLLKVFEMIIRKYIEVFLRISSMVLTQNFTLTNFPRWSDISMIGGNEIIKTKFTPICCNFIRLTSPHLLLLVLFRHTCHCPSRSPTQS